MIRIFTLVAVVVCAIHVSAFAQESNVWVFGHGTGLDFNSGAPVVIETNIDQKEGCASICDGRGQLLFYTDGKYILNRNHQRMPRSTIGLTITTTSTTQAALIVQSISDFNKYYVFSLEQWLNGSEPGRLYYRIVDMTLDNGLGDVVAGTENGILLDTALTEKMTAVPGNNCNIWVVVRDRRSPVCKAYEINIAGLKTTPVLSTIGTNNYGAGTMKFSYDRKKLAMAGGDRLTISDFDPSTGTLSNMTTVASGPSFYGTCFSKDNTKLYACRFDGNVMQYDLSAGNAATLLLYDSMETDIQLAPDGKMYMTKPPFSPMSRKMHVINYPDLAGAACQLVRNAIVLPPNSSGIYLFGLPNVNAFPLLDTVHRRIDLPVCFRDSVVLNPDPAGGNHIWQDGTYSKTYTVHGDGTYWVRYKTTRCEYRVDTIVVTMSPPLPRITTLGAGCREDHFSKAWVVPAPGDTTIYRYQWYNGDGKLLKNGDGMPTDTLSGIGYGKYRLYIDGPFCDTTVDFVITAPVYAAAFAVDTTVCNTEDAAFLNTSTEDMIRWNWDMGDQTQSLIHSPVHRYYQKGTYSVTLIAETNDGCRDTAYATMHVGDIPDISIVTAGDSVCEGVAISLTTASRDGIDTLVWHFEDGVAGFTGWNATYAYNETGKHAIHLRAVSLYCPDTLLDYTVYVFPCIVFIPSAFSPNGDGMNDYFRPVCIEQALYVEKFSIYNRWGQLLWSRNGAEALRGWNGTHKGDPADVGVYFYTINGTLADGTLLDKKGDVTLIR